MRFSWSVALWSICASLIPSRVIAKDAGYAKLLQDYQTSGDAAQPIPKIVHFLHGMKDNPTFELQHYLAVKSAYDVIKAEHIYMWIHFEPTGEYWEKAKDFVTIKKIDLIDSVYGRHIDHFAHRADVLRLMLLYSYGGIYLDLDVVMLHSLDDLLDHDFVLGQEGQGDGVGLCNAVILSKPKAPFLRRWMESYESFDGVEWNLHSVQIPSMLAKMQPSKVHRLPYNAFHWPLWNEPGLQLLYMQKVYDYSKNYAVHLWESNSKLWFWDRLNEDIIREIDLPLFCQMRRFITTGNYSVENDVNCRLATSNIYSDGTLASYTFDHDTQAKVVDQLGNHLHGWALNGTVLVAHPDQEKGGYVRSFRGNGDMVVLPVVQDFTLKDFTLSFKLWMPTDDVCQDAASVIALQSQDYVVLVEGTCLNGNTQTLWLKVFRFLNSEWPVISMSQPTTRALSAKAWSLVTITADSTEHTIRLSLDGVVIAESTSWPPPNVEDKPVANIWLGARPATPWSREPRDITNDLVGSMDDVHVWTRALPAEAVQAAALDRETFFHRQYEFAAAGQVEKVKATYAYSSAGLTLLPALSHPTSRQDSVAPVALPLRFIDAILLASDSWQVSWVVDVDTTAGNLGTHHQEMLRATFGTDASDVPRMLSVAYDGARGHQQVHIHQWCFGSPSEFVLYANSACPIEPGLKTTYVYDWQFDSKTSTAALYCNGAKIFYRAVPYLSFPPESMIEVQSSNMLNVKTVQLRPSLSSPAELRQAAVDLRPAQDCPTFTVEGRTYQGCGQQITLPDNFWRRSTTEITVDTTNALSRLTPVITDTDLSLFFMAVPTASATKRDQETNRFQLAVGGSECGGVNQTSLFVYIPELLAGFNCTLSCDAQFAAKDKIDLDPFKSSTAVYDVNLIDPSNAAPAVIPALADHSLYYKLLVLVVLILLLARIANVPFTYRSARLASPPLSPFHSAKKGPHCPASPPLGGPSQKVSYWRKLRPRTSMYIALTCALLVLVEVVYLAMPHVSLQSLVALKQGKPSSVHNQTSSYNASYRSRHNHSILSRLPATVSVITPCHAQGHFLEDAALSLRSQTYPYFEWLIIVDGMDMQCLEAAQSIQEQSLPFPVHVIHKPGSGLAETRNVGISFASGSWICPLDADDMLEATYIEKGMAVLKQNPRLSAVFAQQQFFGESDWFFDPEPFSSEGIKRKGLLPVNTIYRKDDWRRVGGYPPALPFGDEDWSFWMSIGHLPGFRVHKIEEPLLFYRFKANSMQRTKEKHTETYPMLQTMHPDKFTRQELEEAHKLIMERSDATTLSEVQRLATLFPGRREPLLWLGLMAEAKGQLAEAKHFYELSAQLDSTELDWQPSARLEALSL